MKQQTLAMAADQGAGFETRRKRTRRDDFLDTMNSIMPWAELCAVVEPYYPKRGNGRPPIGLERTTTRATLSSASSCGFRRW
jgi:IS5 family transposase